MTVEERIRQVKGWFESEPPLLTIKRTAFLLSCSERQVHRHIAHDLLETIKFGTGRSVKRSVLKDSVIKFILSNMS